ncbi:methyltransferase domain-containing protein [Rhizobium puerariae]|uniref:Methyltransferase domain-containing protein n=1 Tax=Rhizobium puerariae TaxID=1585791 RepID=A0ABV6ADB5_9HYPH
MQGLKMQNWSVKDDIREYWTIRAETYDLSPGHGIARLGEMDAWKRLITGHLGEAGGRNALDLACGTGVMTMLMHDLGFNVTGLDFTEAMMAKARRKAERAEAPVRFLTRDAEETMEPDAGYDVIVARHLVWTLVDPGKAFREWFRILKPGGRLLIIDGDFVRKSWLERLVPLLDRIFGKPQDGHSLLTPEQWRAHDSIVERVHFSGGVRSGDVRGLFERAGFEGLKVDTGLSDIRKSRGIGRMSRSGLISTLQHRFAISGEKPLA